MIRPLRIASCLLALVGMAFAAAQPAANPAADKDKLALQGKWVVVAYEVNGKVDTDAAGLYLTVDGGKLSIGMVDAAPIMEAAIATLDPGKNPKAMDVVYKGQKNSSLGIYELNEDDLKLCIAGPDAPGKRPANFSDKKHSVYTLRRYVDLTVSAGEDAKLIQGKWEVTALQENGKDVPLPRDKGKLSLFFFGNNRIKIMLGNTVTNDTLFFLDESRKPRAIDVVDKWDREPREKLELVMLGIYELNIDKKKGDTLKLCLARQSNYKGKEKPGKDATKPMEVKDKEPKDKEPFSPEDREKDRPTKFVSAKEVGLITLKRVRIEPGDLFGFKGSTKYLEPQQEWLTLQQIAQAMQQYEKVNNKFPAAAICDANGKPLLSWRVALLPYIDQIQLYRQIKIDEPWDSDYNKQFLLKMPDVYVIPNAKAGAGMTNYRVIVGDGAGFDMVKGMKASDISHGLANTLLVVQSADGVPWTKPDELVYSAPQKTLPAFADFNKDGRFLASFYDGHIEELNSKTDAEKILRAITRAGGEKPPPKK